MTNMYAISLNIKNKNCIVIGGGNVAVRKIQGLLECGANVTVISKEVAPVIQELESKGMIKLKLQPYTQGDLGDSYLVICATDNEGLNAKVAKECLGKGILVNVVDDPSLCSFFVSSTIRQGDLAISVSTNGQSPLLASKIKRELESQFGTEYKAFLELLGYARKRAKAECNEPEKRKLIYKSIVNSDVIELLRSGQESLAKERIDQCISSLLD